MREQRGSGGRAQAYARSQIEGTPPRCEPSIGVIISLTPRAPCRVIINTALEELHLCGCHVSGHACGVLAASIPRSRLRRLDLSLNPFGDEGAWCLAWALPECASTLTVLNLSSCNVGDDGADEIREALALVDEATESIRSQLYDAEHGRSDHPVGEAHVQSAIFEAANLAMTSR